VVVSSSSMDTSTPLAYRLRPKTLDEFSGQHDVVGVGTPLRKAIEQDLLTSVIFAGPPGTGKTTLAKIIAEATKAQFTQLNAVTSGVKDIKEVCAQAERLKTSLKQRTVLFIDEIHRFNKSQQDALLPSVENGNVILIGATTENPYFSVNSALISRSQVYLLKPHNVDDLVAILERALKSPEGYNGKISMHPDAIKKIAENGNGDARIALNLLEMAILMLGTKISREDADKLLKQRSMRYDKKGEDHYDTISVFIKSMRGSDVDASLLWMYKMIASGEEPRFLFRRMCIFASEDIGNADPRALQIVVSAWQAFEMVGMPEGDFFLAHACIYLAQAPKSNAVYTAKEAAKMAVSTSPGLEVPLQFRNAPVKAMREQHGYHVGYQYPHSTKDAIVEEDYFPIDFKGERNFYEPSDRGFEAEVRERIARAKKLLRS
jgi:putative ATPase